MALQATRQPVSNTNPTVHKKSDFPVTTVFKRYCVRIGDKANMHNHPWLASSKGFAYSAHR